METLDQIKKADLYFKIKYMKEKLIKHINNEIKIFPLYFHYLEKLTLLSKSKFNDTICNQWGCYNKINQKYYKY